MALAAVGGFQSFRQGVSEAIVGKTAASGALPLLGESREAAGWNAFVRGAQRAGQGLTDRATSGQIGYARKSLREGRSVDNVATKLGDTPGDKLLTEVLADVDKVENKQFQKALVRAVSLAKEGEVAAVLDIIENVRRARADHFTHDLTEKLEDAAFFFGPDGAAPLNFGATQRYRHVVETLPEIANNVTEAGRRAEKLQGVDHRERAARLRYLAASNPVRRLYVDALQRDFNAWQNVPIKEANVGIIGAGFHGSVAARAIRDVAPDARVVVLEAGKKVNPTFLEGGQGVFSNSKTFPSLLKTITNPVKANRNEVPGSATQVGDISPLRNPQIRYFGEVAADVLNSAGVPIKFESPARFIEDLPNGKSIVHYANGEKVELDAVIVATGIGVPRISIGDADSQRLIKSDVDKFSLDLKDKIPAVWTSTDFRNWFDNADDPRRAFNDLDTVLVIGAGDSSWTVAEAILGFAPEEIYAQGLQGFTQPKKIIIATTPGGPKNVDEFLNALSGSTPTTRDRYGRILNALRTMEIEFVPEYAVNVRSSGKTKTKNGQSWRPVNVYLDKDSVPKTEGIEPIEVDRVVTSAGFVSQIGKVLGLPEGQRIDDLERIVGTIEGWEGETFLGRRFGNSIIIGPTGGKDVVPFEQYGPFAVNDASIFNRGARSRAAAIQVAKRLLKEKRQLLGPVEPPKPERLAARVDEAGTDTRLTGKRKKIQKLKLVDEEALLSLRLAEFFDRFTYEAGEKLSVRFERTDEGLRIQMKNYNDQRMIDALNREGELLYLLDRNVGRRLNYRVDLRKKYGEPGTLRHYTWRRD